MKYNVRVKENVYRYNTIYNINNKYNMYQSPLQSSPVIYAA